MEGSLEALIGRIAPELVIASGDLTHRGRPDEHDRAARFLRGLGVPVLAVPGNHDIPYAFPGRLTHPWREFERRWGTTEPVYASRAIFAVGVNSVRPWRHQSGGVGGGALERAAERLRSAPAGAVRVVALHHQLLNAPWRTRKRPVARRSSLLATLAGAGAELIVGGHVHQAAVGERSEFEVLRGDVPATVVSIAPGLGRPRPRRSGEARGLHVYAVEPEAIEVDSFLWDGGDWRRTARRRFRRGAGPLALSAAAAAARPGR